jgi:thioredoxin-related protein
MKRTILTGVAICVLSAGTTAAATGWMTDFQKATEQAGREDVYILADFSGSDWCGWCIRLDEEVFSQPQFKAFAEDNLVLFLADFPRNKPQPETVKTQNRELAEQYGIRGFPTVLLLDSDGKVVARTGYRPGGAEAYIEHLKTLMKED